MSKRVSIGVTVAIAAVAVAVTFCVTVDVMTGRFNSQMSEMLSMRSIYSKLQEIGALVDENAYFEPDDELRDENIARAYAQALRDAGDNYARYYTAEEYEQNQKQVSGGGGGLGISLINDDNRVYVYNVIHGSPAYVAGMRPGDVITAVSDASGAELASAADGYEKMYEAMKTETGDTLTLSLLRGEEMLSVQVTSAEYSVESVWVEYAGDTAIVRITAFNGDTDERFIEIIDELESNESVTGVVFDVRNNGGGLLTTVVNMLDRLLPEGVIVTQTDKDGNVTAEYKSDDVKFSKPMCVLVNGSTASAAELFSCALRDYDKAELVGTPTYGKGCVQTTYVLSDGSAICFTTAMYNPPSSGNYDGVPLQPDETVELTEEQTIAFYSLTADTDPQLAAAISKVSVNDEGSAAA